MYSGFMSKSISDEKILPLALFHPDKRTEMYLSVCECVCMCVFDQN